MIGKKIGSYSLLSLLGKGGMGEVFLAYDSLCKRQIALKKIRDDLANNPVICNRFLREAIIASRLSHPSILPIYTLDKAALYYTMPYIEGETLKRILVLTRQMEEKGQTHPIGSSIPELMRIFLRICEAMAYTHAKGILHRDLKAENIIIGKYGEVLLLDWGVASFVGEKEKNLFLEKETLPDITKPGKISGTLTYMPPERARGERASFTTDIYALGVLLYQLLTLHLPFNRTTLADFRKNAHLERVIDPAEKAPYRDLPVKLIQITQKLLSFNKNSRFQSVDDLILELKKYIEGQPEWLLIDQLKIEDEDDWQLQENVLMARHVILTPNPESHWFNMMVSKNPFPGNLKIETSLYLEKSSRGLGLLLSLPEAKKRKGIEEGYCLWIDKENKNCKLFRSNVLVLEVTNLPIKNECWQQLKIEKVDNALNFYINDQHIFSYSSHLPLSGSHIGFLLQDFHFQIKDFKLFSRTYNVMVNCLTIPDTFLAKGDYQTALNEYRRIARSFPGRFEGREALFRAAITLLEKSKSAKNKREKNKYLQLTSEEFAKLHFTSGEPLEYLGKALIYASEDDFENEANCLELALRKFVKHPLISIINEHIIYRLHESALTSRLSTYRLLLLALSHLPNSFLDNADTKKLINSLEEHWEKLFFIEKLPPGHPDQNKNLAIELSFRLNRTHNIVEIGDLELIAEIPFKNAIFALLELDAISDASFLFKKIKFDSALIESALAAHFEPIEDVFNNFLKQRIHHWNYQTSRALVHILKTALNEKKYAAICDFYPKIAHFAIPFKDKVVIDSLVLPALLFEQKWTNAKNIFANYSLDFLSDPSSPLYSIFGAFLAKTKGAEKALEHFATIHEDIFPKTSSLIGHFLHGKIDLKKGWIEEALFFEKRALFAELILFYHCLGEQRKARFFEKALSSIFLK